MEKKNSDVAEAWLMPDMRDTQPKGLREIGLYVASCCITVKG